MMKKNLSPLAKPVVNIFNKQTESTWPNAITLEYIQSLTPYTATVSYTKNKPCRYLAQAADGHDHNLLQWQSPLHYISNKPRIFLKDNYDQLVTNIAIFNALNGFTEYFNHQYPLDKTNLPKMTLDNCLDYLKFTHIQNIHHEIKDDCFINFFMGIFGENWKILFNMSELIGHSRENRSFQVLLNLLTPAIQNWLITNSPELLTKINEPLKINLDESLFIMLSSIIDAVASTRDDQDHTRSFVYVNEQLFVKLRQDKFISADGLLLTEKRHRRTAKNLSIQFIYLEDVIQSNTEIADRFTTFEQFKIYHYGDYSATLHIVGNQHSSSTQVRPGIKWKNDSIIF